MLEDEMIRRARIIMKEADRAGLRYWGGTFKGTSGMAYTVTVRRVGRVRTD